VSKFQNEIFPSHRAAFEQLQHGQQPLAMFLTCADSRVVPNLFTQTAPGEMFIERNPGALVPGYGEFIGGVSASVEFAMLALEVPLIIVCAHTDCGVMQGLLNPQKAEGLPAVQEWMRHAMDSRHRVLHEHPQAPEKEKLRLLTEFAVLQQIENLKTHPSVASRLAKHEVEIRGWIYDIGKGEVRQADPDSGEFAVLAAE
jgi:carbonic anhydrase